MQLASQCLRHLIRARRGRWQPSQRLDTIRQTASSPSTAPRTGFSSSGTWNRASVTECLAPGHARADTFQHPGVGPDAPHSRRVKAKATVGPRSPPNNPRARSAVGGQERKSLVPRVGPDLEGQLDTPTARQSLREADVSLLDIPENENDASVWLGRLDAAERDHGRDGVHAIWDAVERRRALCEVNSDGAELFWNTVLKAVLHDEGRLRRVVLYAEWMFKAHAVQWPSLYCTTMFHCLRHGQHRRAIQWHLRLMPRFEPGAEAFGALLREFIACPGAELQQTLKALYATSLYRNMYDELIPPLYESGLSLLCAEWRSLFIRYRDLPQPTAKSQPYLRFLVRYYPGTQLELEEQLVVDLHSPAYWDLRNGSLWDAMNGTHDDDNDSSGRRYSDTLGARWFASSWVPLDFAIHAIHALGVRQIGPLSLQSIALREPTPRAVMSRIKQLHKVNIGIGHSTYARAVRHFAERENSELLAQLLNSDIHPDVFDDPAMLQSIRDKALETGAWRTHQLLLEIQPAIVQHSIESTSNLLLQQQLKQRQTTQALALMDDMRSMNIDMSATSLQHIYSHILDPLPWRINIEPANWETLKTAITYLNRLVLLRKPVYSRYWQKVLFGLGRFGRFRELETQCLGILDAHQAWSTLEGGLLPAHPMDAPPSTVGGSAENVLIPADLPLANTYHPIRKIFDNRELHGAIVRWGFKAGMSQETADRARRLGDVRDAPEFVAAQGVRLLARLHERGVPFETDLVREEVIKCLAKLYHPQRGNGPYPNRIWGDLSFTRRLVNEAAGRALLPGIINLRNAMACKWRTRGHETEKT